MLRSQQQRQQAAAAAAAASFAGDQHLCVVCLDAPKNCVLLPCRHLAACSACAGALWAKPEPCCPVCRTPLVNFIEAFL